MKNNIETYIKAAILPIVIAGFGWLIKVERDIAIVKTTQDFIMRDIMEIKQHMGIDHAEDSDRDNDGESAYANNKRPN